MSLLEQIEIAVHQHFGGVADISHTPKRLADMFGNFVYSALRIGAERA